MEFADAIKEGDGKRVHRCWKYLLPIFKSSGRKNYSIEALQMLNQVEFTLTRRESAELIWNRFVNTHGHGRKGRNIPCDLHMEHINRLCKDAVYGLQANKTASAIVRVGKSLGPLSIYNLRNVSPLYRPICKDNNYKRIYFIPGLASMSFINHKSSKACSVNIRSQHISPLFLK